MTNFADTISVVATRLLGHPNRNLSSKDEWRYGTHGSLSIKVGGPHKGTWSDHETSEGGGVLDLIARHQRCDRPAAMQWLKSEIGDVAGAPETAAGKRVVATYAYTDAGGDVVFEVVRYEPKEFRQRRPDGKGGYLWNLTGVQPVPYRLPEVIEAIGLGRTVFIVEGEKDADRLWAVGIPATCNAGGAGKWRAEFASYFKKADIVVLPDNDEAGADHADKVARCLALVAATLRVVCLPGLSRKGDVSDWMDNGGSAPGLQTLADKAPLWSPKTASRFPVIWYGEEDAAPPLSWMVKGILITGGLSTIYGPPGTSKTFLALDLALRVAHGFDWFGRPTAQGGVLYVSGEGASGMLSRMKAWRKEFGEGPRAPFALLPSSINLFDNDQDADALVDDIASHATRMDAPLKLIVLDTLSRMIGSGDEDRARDINVLVSRVESLQRETGAHILVVHHSGKDRDRGMRGSNALLGAVDAALEISRHEESGICNVKAIKLKDASGASPFGYKLRQSVLGIDEDGEEISSCVIDPTDASPGAEPRTGRRLTDAERIALDALTEALAEQGQKQPTLRVPTDTLAVRNGVWRDCAFRFGIAEGGDDANKKAFSRTRAKLIANRAVFVDGDWVWRS